MLKNLLASIFLLCATASASVTINATFTDQQGNPAQFAYLEVQLVNCGFNVPVVPGSTAVIVAKDAKYLASQLPVTIAGNNEISCGNSYSTLWHVTAWANNNTKLAGDLNYDICSSSTNCLVTPDPTWNLAQSQPFQGAPPPPGYSSIFGNPVLSQVLNQPAGTTLNMYGNVDLNGSPVCTFALCGGIGGEFTAGLDLAGTNVSQEVIGIEGNILPALTPGCLNWGSVAWVFTPCISTPSSSGDQLISGGGVEWTGGLTFTVGAATYTIAGIQYSSGLTNEALATADPTNPRLDVIGVNNAGAVFVLTGTPAANPSVPSVDPTSQLALTIILVPAGSSTASVTKADIYHENTEWTTAKSGTPIDLASTTFPYDGTVSIEATAATTGNYAQMTDPSSGTVQMQNYNNLIFYLDSKATWPTTRSISVQWFNGATAKGAPVVISSTGTVSFNSSITGMYQQIAVPTSLFGINGIPVTTVRFTVTGTGATIGWFLDDITLQGGQNGNPSGSFLTWRGTWSASTGYNANDVAFYNFASWVALNANTGSTPSLSNGNWAVMTSAGVNQQVLFNDAGFFNGDPGMLYNKATAALTLSGAMSAASYTSTSAGAYTLTGAEGAAPSGSVGSDILWADSTAHRWKMNNNNGGAFNVPGVASAGTSGHCLSLTANGIDYQDAGAPCGSGSGSVTSIATTSPITGGTITTTGTIACATCAIGPGASTANHIAEFSSTDGVTLKDGGSAVVASNIQNQSYTYAAGGGTANAQTVTLSPAVGSLVTGQYACWLPSNPNSTTTPTLAVNGLTAKTLVKANGAALAANDLVTTQIACAIYDGTNYELQNPATGGGGAVGSKTVNIPFDQCTPAQSTNAGNSFYTTNAFTNWDAGVWSFVLNTAADIYCSIKIPHNVDASPAALIIFDVSANDATASHTDVFSTKDAISSSKNLQVGSLSAGSPSTCTFTTTGTAYAVTECSITPNATIAADQYLVVDIHQAASSSVTANVVMPPPMLQLLEDF